MALYLAPIPEQRQKDHFTQLNRDVLFTILVQELSLKDVLAVCNSNKQMQNFCKQRGVWEQLFMERTNYDDDDGSKLNQWRYERDVLGMTNDIAHLMGYMHKHRFTDKSVFPWKSGLWMNKNVSIVIFSEKKITVHHVIQTLRSSMAEILPHLKFMEHLIDLEKSINPNTIFFYNDNHYLLLKDSVALHELFYYMLLNDFKVRIPNCLGKYTRGTTILQGRVQIDD
jgi:hypothetical protein